MICKYCGAPIEDGAHSCEYCGKEIYQTVRIGKAEENTSKKVFEDEEKPSYLGTRPIQNIPEKTDSSSIVKAIICLLAFTSVFFLCWGLFVSSGPPTPEISNNGSYFSKGPQEMLDLMNKGLTAKEKFGSLSIVPEKNNSGMDVYSAQAPNGTMLHLLCEPTTLHVNHINTVVPKESGGQALLFSYCRNIWRLLYADDESDEILSKFNKLSWNQENKKNTDYAGICFQMERYDGGYVMKTYLSGKKQEKDLTS